MKKKVVFGMAALAILGMSGCGKENLNLVSDQVKIELGSEPDPMVTTYVELDEAAASEAVIDFSAVDVMTVGTYAATVTYREQTVSFDVTVQDTTAPYAEVADNVTVEAGSPLYAEAVLTGITELSGEVSITFQEVEIAAGVESAEEGTETAAGDESTEEPAAGAESFVLGNVSCNNASVVYPAAGAYDNQITVVDASGNSSEIPVHIVVGAAPVIGGVEDLSVKTGGEIDYLEGITATDCNGNDLTEKIECNSSAVDLDKAGAYEVTYTVADENGFTAEKKAAVTVSDTTAAKDTEKKTSSGTPGSSGNSETKETASTTTGSSGSGSNGNSGSGNSGSGSNGNSGSGNSGSGSNGNSGSGNSGSGSNGSSGSENSGSGSNGSSGNGNSGSGNDGSSGNGNSGSGSNGSSESGNNESGNSGSGNENTGNSGSSDGDIYNGALDYTVDENGNITYDFGDINTGGGTIIDGETGEEFPNGQG